MLLRNILIAATACVFMGRAWQHIRWDGPYRSLFWDEALFGPILQLFSSQSWNEYVTSPIVDKNIQYFTFAVGIVFLLATIASGFCVISGRWQRVILGIGTVALSFMFLCMWKDRFFQVGQLIEHACQLAAPILLTRWHRVGADKKWGVILKVAISLTFIGHGLYAVGYHPQPGPFNDMLLNIFGMSDPTANVVLIIAGILDFVCAVAIWLPIVQKPFVWYLIIWGFLTALARVASGFSSGLILYTLEQTWHESLFRLAHGILPLLLLPTFQKLLSPFSEVKNNA